MKRDLLEIPQLNGCFNFYSMNFITDFTRYSSKYSSPKIDYKKDNSDRKLKRLKKIAKACIF